MGILIPIIIIIIGNRHGGTLNLSYLYGKGITSKTRAECVTILAISCFESEKMAPFPTSDADPPWNTGKIILCIVNVDGIDKR